MTSSRILPHCDDTTILTCGHLFLHSSRQTWPSAPLCTPSSAPLWWRPSAAGWWTPWWVHTNLVSSVDQHHSICLVYSLSLVVGGTPCVCVWERVEEKGSQPYFDIEDILMVWSMKSVLFQNGFWLGLGWSIFFFMPSLILSVKLAKHFRRMLYSDGYDSPKRY